MTPAKTLRNVPASVRQRLLNYARDRRIEFQAVLDRFVAERFLYRLSVSGEVERFVLKGAALFRIWDGEEARPTRDIDFLDIRSEGRAPIHDALETICRVPCPEDGVLFDPATIRLAEIRGVQADGAVRARIMGRLDQIRLPLQIDIGVGDLITPEPEEREYPTLLDLPAPRLWTYPRETVVAEKLHAMVEHDARNTRVKDLWDIASLARHFPFDGEVLRTAITDTFRRRGVSLAGESVVALLPAYYEDPVRLRLWGDFRREIRENADGPARLVDAGNELREFLGPVCDGLIEDRPFTHAWPAGGPWRPGVQARRGGEGRD